MTDLSISKNFLENPHLAGIAASLYDRGMVRDLALFMANTQNPAEIKVFNADHNPDLIRVIPETRGSPQLLASVSAKTMLNALAEGQNSIVSKFGSLAKILKSDTEQFKCLVDVFNKGIGEALESAPKDDMFFSTNMTFLKTAIKAHPELQQSWNEACVRAKVDYKVTPVQHDKKEMGLSPV